MALKEASLLNSPFSGPRTLPEAPPIEPLAPETEPGTIPEPETEPGEPEPDPFVKPKKIPAVEPAKD